MRVINYDGINITVLDTEDKRLPHGAEDLFTPEEFKDYFDIDFSRYTHVIYEPQRNFFLVEKGGKSSTFNKPSEETVLNQIDKQADEILDYLVLRHLRKELPSKYHRIEDYKIVLPKKNQAEYAKHQAEKEAWNYLNDTAWYLQREQEAGIPVPEEIKQRRLESYKLVSDTYAAKRTGVHKYTGLRDKEQHPVELSRKLAKDNEASAEDT